MVIKNVVAAVVVATCLQFGSNEPIPKKQDVIAHGLHSWDRPDWYDELNSRDEEYQDVIKCSARWRRFGDSEYLACNGGVLSRHISAKKLCRRNKGELVTINSKAEFEFVVQIYGGGGKHGKTIWTSACKKNSKFLWSDGRELSVNDPLWCYGEPDDLNDPEEDRVVIEWEDGRWCYNEKNQWKNADFVCERKVLRHLKYNF